MPEHQATTPFTLERLAAQRSVTIAIDTEFRDALTLTIQAATRISRSRVVVQVYRSPAIPPPPAGFDPAAYLPADVDRYGRFFSRLSRWKTRMIAPDLSPARILADLFRLEGVMPVSRHEGRRLVASRPRNASRKPGEATWSVPTIRFALVGHFLPADFGRCFGRDFYDDLLGSRPDGERPLAFAKGSVVGLTYANGSAYSDAPVVEYAQSSDGSLYEIRLETRDTNQLFNPGSLDALGQAFLGLPKSDALAGPDKEDMARTFREKTAEAYGYAIADVVNTLLLREGMEEADRDIYRSFDFADAEIPPMKGTLGSRTAEFLRRMTSRAVAGSEVLKNERAVRGLMKKGGRASFGGERAASRFGFQAGQVHGGLNFSRSPTRFWHESPGMLRDVDMSGCYTAILGGVDVYWGKPVVNEPGNGAMTLCQTVESLEASCAPDAWYVRVTGDIRAGFNTLIPSSADAITASNYRRSKPVEIEPEGSRLYSGRVESGVVTHATWRMIGTLPPAMRADYEQLSVESLVFYPRKLAAVNGPEYDRLVASLGQEPLPWEATLDLEGLVKTTVERLDADYATVRFRLGEIAGMMAGRRLAASQGQGKGQGRALAWKRQANTIYGILASTRMATSNAVAGNVTTATGRAEAFAMINALNGIQVITDGCTYRRDQVPACTFAECLELQDDYPLRRAEAGGQIPFLDPAGVPLEDGEFTAWYRSHARRFFGGDAGAPEGAFGLHDLEHKVTLGRPSFDALACDGGNCYVKCVQAIGGSWKALDTSMRGHGPASKEAVTAWMLGTYSGDRMEALPPIADDRILLKAEEARRRTRRYLNEGVSPIVMPLGHHDRKVHGHRPIRLSSFVYRDPGQRKAIQRQLDRLACTTGCGPEVLALRRGYAGRPATSLVAIATEMYNRIKAGQRDLSGSMHLTRLSTEMQERVEERRLESDRLTSEAREDLLRRIDGSRLDAQSLTAAILCTSAEATWLA